MSEFAGNLPQKFISFRHLGFESSAHNLPEEGGVGESPDCGRKQRSEYC